MEQTCSNKVISLHFQKCGGDCHHASECYFVKREVATNYDLSEWNMVWQSLVHSGYTVHESICSEGVTEWHQRELEKNPSYNITLTCTELRKRPRIWKFSDQLQVSVFLWEDVCEFYDYQKLYLIKNENTYRTFKAWLGKDTGKLHFLIAQDFVTEDIIKEVIPLFNNNCSKEQTMDSCLTSFVVNGCCPYSDGNYIDINFDGTVRACPYSSKGILPQGRASNLDQLFGLKQLPPKCKYIEIFGDLNGRTDSTVTKSYVTNKGNGSCS